MSAFGSGFIQVEGLLPSLSNSWNTALSGRGS